MPVRVIYTSPRPKGKEGILYIAFGVGFYVARSTVSGQCEGLE